MLITEELHSRIWDNSSTISTISLEKSTESFSSPYIFQALYCSTVFYVMRILDLQGERPSDMQFVEIRIHHNKHADIQSNVVAAYKHTSLMFVAAYKSKKRWYQCKSKQPNKLTCSKIFIRSSGATAVRDLQDTKKIIGLIRIHYNTKKTILELSKRNRFQSNWIIGRCNFNYTTADWNLKATHSIHSCIGRICNVSKEFTIKIWREWKSSSYIYKTHTITRSQI